MKVLWLSDQHWDFISPKELMKYGHSIGNIAKNEDHITISGDLASGNNLVFNIINFVDSVREVNKDVQISFVLGNHDFYGTSIKESRSQVHLAADRLGVTYLTKEDPVLLSNTTALLGTDGWADGGFGNVHGPLLMSDWTLIKDLKPIYRAFGVGKLAEFCKELAQQEVTNISHKIAKVVNTHKNIIIVTHVPPWKEATWHENGISNDTFLPWFSSRVMGEYLMDIANINKDNNFTVLCSHTHGSGVYTASKNMKCYTGFAEYSRPKIAGTLSIGDNGVVVESFHNPHGNVIY